MKINSNNTKLLADILAYAILIEFEDVDSYDEFSDEIIIEKTKNDIIQLAEQLLPQELFNEYSEFKKSKNKE